MPEAHSRRCNFGVDRPILPAEAFSCRKRTPGDAIVPLGVTGTNGLARVSASARLDVSTRGRAHTPPRITLAQRRNNPSLRMAGCFRRASREWPRSARLRTAFAQFDQAARRTAGGTPGVRVRARIAPGAVRAARVPPPSPRGDHRLDSPAAARPVRDRARYHRGTTAGRLAKTAPHRRRPSVYPPWPSVAQRLARPRAAT